MRGAGLGGGARGNSSGGTDGLTNLLRDLSSREHLHGPSAILASEASSSSSDSTTRCARRKQQKRQQEQCQSATSVMSPASQRVTRAMFSPDWNHASLASSAAPGAAFKLFKRVLQSNAEDSGGVRLQDALEEGAGRANDMQPKETVVQALYNACREAFGGGVGGSEARVQSILDTMTPADVGLEDFCNPTVPNKRRNTWPFTQESSPLSLNMGAAPPITFLDLYECDKFSICIFCLPPFARLPLHNHPGMTVLSRVLSGSIHVRAFDWVNMDEERSAEPRPARLVEDTILTSASETEILYPTIGNIHEFSALSAPCVVLDVLAPPYNFEEGRVCSYFRETKRPSSRTGSTFSNSPPSPIPANEDSQSSSSSSTISGGTCGTSVDEEPTVWLQECPPPFDFVTRRGEYRGPPISC
eukprot:TRINITY_DN23120_c0_g1_i1.p1 TRINITY_DN23120_c0_g1~~TRINITY_DN23120_c0_g1_i1.p1  ORF type:complete len:415 (+),score=58.49 TRINITY_DN23120_c0_g1_i1:619-1863(+)